MAGIFVLLLPFYKINKYIFIAQAVIALYLFITARNLFATWHDKKVKIDILLGKNRDEFRPDTFEVFMQYPCSRLLVRHVLSKLGKSNEYKNLLKFKRPLIENIIEGYKPVKTVVFINENFKKDEVS